MYMLYLTTAISLTVGIGAFVQYDKEQRQVAEASQTQVDVARDHQQRFSRALRRQFNINPAPFPPVANGEFVRLDEDIINAANLPGYLDMGMSDFYIDGNGYVIGIMIDGRIGLAGGNGDAAARISSPIRDMDSLLDSIHGKKTGKDRFDRYQNGNQDPDLRQADLDRTADRLSAKDFARIPATMTRQVARLDLDALGYNDRIASASFQPREDDISLAARD